MTDYKPVLIYGFKEVDDDIFISYNILSNFGINLYTTKIIDDFATDIIYGLPITIEEINVINCSNKIDVDNFIILKNLEIKPMIYNCIDGPFILNKSEYYDLFT